MVCIVATSRPERSSCRTGFPFQAIPSQNFLLSVVARIGTDCGGRLKGWSTAPRHSIYSDELANSSGRQSIGTLQRRFWRYPDNAGRQCTPYARIHAGVGEAPVSDPKKTCDIESQRFEDFLQRHIFAVTGVFRFPLTAPSHLIIRHDRLKTRRCPFGITPRPILKEGRHASSWLDTAIGGKIR